MFAVGQPDLGLTGAYANMLGRYHRDRAGVRLISIRVSLRSSNIKDSHGSCPSARAARPQASLPKGAASSFSGVPSAAAACFTVMPILTRPNPQLKMIDAVAGTAIRRPPQANGASRINGKTFTANAPCNEWACHNGIAPAGQMNVSVVLGHSLTTATGFGAPVRSPNSFPGPISNARPPNPSTSDKRPSAALGRSGNARRSGRR